MKDIKGYEGLYAITSDGQVWNYRTKMFMKQRVNRGGYLIVNLNKNGKKITYTVHQLVAKAYIPNPNNLPQINHKDENKQNNCVENLEWVSAKENSNYGTRNERVAKSHSKPVYCVELDKVFESASIAARALNLFASAIGQVCKGKSKSTHGYNFKYWEVV